MAYDKALAERIRAALPLPMTEKKMFGGVGFLLDGHMACGIYQDYLIIRVGVDGYGEALSRPHTKPLDIRGGEMRGWVMVAPEGCQDEESLMAWIRQGVQVAGKLPPK